MKKYKKLPWSTRLKGLLAALALKGAGALPISLSQRLGKVLGLLMINLNVREVKIARRNLELCFPHFKESKRQELLRSSFVHSGMQMFEIAYLWRSSTDKAIDMVKSVQGMEVFEEALANKAGVLLILPHLGNWEVINAYLVKHLNTYPLWPCTRQHNSQLLIIL